MSDDKTAWGDAAASGTFPNDAAQKEVLLKTPRRGRYVRFAALSEVRKQPFAAVAEFDAIVGP